MKIKNKFAIIITVLLCGCGFQPLYTAIDSSEILSQVDIAVSSGSLPLKLDHLMKLQLEKEFDSFQKESFKKYKLDVFISHSNLSFGVKEDATNTRIIVAFNAKLVLKKMPDLQVIFEDVVTGNDSFQITMSPYATFISEEENLHKIAQMISNEIKIRTLSFFSNYKNDY